MNDLLKVPRTKKGVETLNNILSAATQLFYEKGYYGANIVDITARAGVATGTFYVYFDSKLSLYKYLLLQFGHRIRKELSIKTQDCANRREAERIGLRSWLEFVIENPYVYNIIWESLYIDRSLFTEYYETFCASYLRGLNAARENGEVADIDGEVLAYALMGVSNFLGLKYGMFSNRPVDLDYISSEAMKLLERGMFVGEAPAEQASAEQERSMSFRVEVDFDFLGQENPGETGK